MPDVGPSPAVAQYPPACSHQRAHSQQMCLREAAADELNSERQAVRRQSNRKGNRRQARVAPRGIEGGVPGGRQIRRGSERGGTNQQIGIAETAFNVLPRPCLMLFGLAIGRFRDSKPLFNKRSQPRQVIITVFAKPRFVARGQLIGKDHTVLTMHFGKGPRPGRFNDDGAARLKSCKRRLECRAHRLAGRRFKKPAEPGQLGGRCNSGSRREPIEGEARSR